MVSRLKMNHTEISKCCWEQCTAEFATPQLLFSHIKQEHCHKDTLVCRWGDCTKTTTLRSNLISHLHKHIRVIKETCYICDKQFKWKNDYRRHNKIHSKGQKIFNDVVNELFQ